MRYSASTRLIIEVIYLCCWVVVAVAMPLQRFGAWLRSKRSSPAETPTPSPTLPAWLRREVSNMMKRGVGYCEDTDCEDYAKGVFLLNHGNTFYCPRCQKLGHVEEERGSAANGALVFKEVRVEYNFELTQRKYREIAIVRDESLWGRNNVYTLQSALIKTEARALKVAEAILANLNRYPGVLDGDDIPRTTEVILSWDDSLADFAQKLHQVSEKWVESDLIQAEIREQSPTPLE